MLHGRIYLIMRKGRVAVADVGVCGQFVEEVLDVAADGAGSGSVRQEREMRV